MVISKGKSILERLFDEECVFRTSLQNHFEGTTNNLIEFIVQASLSKASHLNTS
jgi:hypothetical protein